MNVSFKFGVLALCVAALATSVSSCKDNDAPYVPVIPTVETVNAISGSVAAINGDAISGATVTLSGDTSAEIKTDATGTFFFPNLKPGTYTITVVAEGKISKSYTVTIANDGKGHIAVWNAVLAGENSQVKVNVTAAQGGEGKETSEALKGNELAEIPIEVSAESNSLNKDAVITVTPIYSSEESKLASSRADEDIVLIGANISCNDPSVEILKPIELTFEVDPLTIEHITAKKLVGDQWVDVEYRVEGNNTIVSADRFTSYALFGKVVFTSHSHDVKLDMQPWEWNNLNGTDAIMAESSTFQYKVGMEITSTANSVFSALLIEALARTYGVNNLTATGTYPLNTEVPVGVYLSVSGIQHYYDVSAALGGITVKGTHYGDVTVNTFTQSSQHNGGGSIPN